MQDNVKEREDNNVEEAHKSLRHASAWAPLHGPARVLRHHRVELLGCSRIRAMWLPSCSDHQPVRAP